MNNIEITSRVTQIISGVFEISPDLVNHNLGYDTCEVWDSMNHMQLVLALEQAFLIQIPDEAALDMLTFEAVVRTVTELVNTNET